VLKMKQIVCTQPDEFKLREVDVPVSQAGFALIRVQRIGICGTDFHAYKGNQPYFTYPRVLGHELAGVIEALGENAGDFHIGDQVGIIPYLQCGQCIACRKGKTNCCTKMKVLGVHQDGGMCEFIAVPVDHLLLTTGLTLDQTACLEPLSIGAHAVRRSELKMGEFVLVIGAGPIGLGVMAAAKLQEAKVIAMDINDERLLTAQTWGGADYTVNALEQPQEAIVQITGGDYPTVVFDASGNTRSMNSALNYLAHGGKLVFVGLVKDDISFPDPEFHKRETTIMGSRNATLEDFQWVMQALRNGTIDVSRFITHRIAFDETIGRFNDLLKPESKVIKAMIVMND